MAEAKWVVGVGVGMGLAGLAGGIYLARRAWPALPAQQQPAPVPDLFAYPIDQPGHVFRGYYGTRAAREAAKKKGSRDDDGVVLVDSPVVFDLQARATASTRLSNGRLHLEFDQSDSTTRPGEKRRWAAIDLARETGVKMPGQIGDLYKAADSESLANLLTETQALIKEGYAVRVPVNFYSL